MLFLPFLIFWHEVLPPQTPAPGENAAQFSARIQGMIADRLKIGTVSHSWVAKDTFMQAVGVYHYDPRHWSKLPTNLEEERAQIRARAQAPSKPTTVVAADAPDGQKRLVKLRRDNRQAVKALLDNSEECGIQHAAPAVRRRSTLIRLES
jgi:hypothetical protein